MARWLCGPLAALEGVLALAAAGLLLMLAGPLGSGLVTAAMMFIPGLLLVALGLAVVIGARRPRLPLALAQVVLAVAGGLPAAIGLQTGSSDPTALQMAEFSLQLPLLALAILLGPVAATSFGLGSACSALALMRTR